MLANTTNHDKTAMLLRSWLLESVLPDQTAAKKHSYLGICSKLRHFFQNILGKCVEVYSELQIMWSFKDNSGVINSFVQMYRTSYCNTMGIGSSSVC